MAAGVFGWTTMTAFNSMGMVSDVSSLRASISASRIPASQAIVIDEELAKVENDARWLRIEPRVIDKLVGAVEYDLETLSELAQIESELDSLLVNSRLSENEKKQAAVIVARIVRGLHDEAITYRQMLKAAEPIRSKSFGRMFDSGASDRDLKRFLFSANELANLHNIDVNVRPIRYDKTICMTIFLALEDKLPEPEYPDFY